MVLGWFNMRNVEILPGFRLAQGFLSGMMPSFHFLEAQEGLQPIWVIQAAPGSLEELQVLVIRGDVGVEGAGHVSTQS